MVQNAEHRNKFLPIPSTNILQGSQEYPIGNAQFLQQMVLGKLDNHIRNKIKPLSYTSLVVQLVTETHVRFLGWEDPLEKG